MIKRLVPSLLSCFLMLWPARALAQATVLDLYGFLTFEWEADDVPGTSSTFDLHHFTAYLDTRRRTVGATMNRAHWLLAVADPRR